MSFPRYDSYRDSGVEWLGQVPSYWQACKLKHVAVFSGGGTPSRDRPEFWNGDVPWVSPKDMKTERLNETEEAITAAALENSATSVVEPAAILMVVRSGILKHTIPVAINEVAVALNQDMKALRFDQRCTPEFFLRWVQGNNRELLLAWSKQGATVESIEFDYLAETRIPLPPPDEQRVITAFLDRETAKIDALVEAQRRLIELLNEKRQAVISHAVTKGLDPSVAMKDSGVEWLGEVPSRWEVVPLKRIWSVTDCKHVTPEFVDEGIPLASIREVQARYVDLAEAKQTTERYFEEMIEGGRRPEPGDLIFSRNASVGEVAEVADWHPPFAMGQDVCLLRKIEQGASTSFLYLTLKSQLVAEQLALAMVGATFKRVNVADIRELIVLNPPPEDQHAVVAAIEGVGAKFDALIDEAERAILLLQELRAALISAAVTGKIDVRGAAVAKDAA